MAGGGPAPRLGHPGMGPAPMGMGMSAMGVSPGPLSGAVVNEAAHERHRLDGRRRLDDQRRTGDWRRRDGRDGREEDRWRGGGQDGGSRGGGGRRDRADSAGETAQPPPEEEPEEGELVIEPSFSSAQKARPPPSANNATKAAKGSRWGDAAGEESTAATSRTSSIGAKGEAGSGNATGDAGPGRPSRDRTQASAGTRRKAVSGDRTGDGNRSEGENEEGELGSPSSAGASAIGKQKAGRSSDTPSKPAERSVKRDSALERHSSKYDQKRIASDGKEGKDGCEAAAAGKAIDPPPENEAPPSSTKIRRSRPDTDGRVEETGSLGGASPPRKAPQEATPSQAEQPKSTGKVAARTGSPDEAKARGVLNGGRESAGAPVGKTKRTGTPKRGTSDEDAVRPTGSGATSPTGRADPAAPSSQPSHSEPSSPSKPSSTVTEERVDGVGDGAAGRNSRGETATGDHQSVHAKKINTAETPQGTGKKSPGASATVGDDSTAGKGDTAHGGPRVTGANGNEDPEKPARSEAVNAKGAGTDAADDPSVNKVSSLNESGAVGADAPKRRSTGGDAGDLAPFLRKDHRRRPSASTAAAAAASATAQPPASSNLTARETSEEVAPDVGAAAAAKPERVSVFSRLGAQPGVSTNDKTAANASEDGPVDSSGKGSDRPGPVGLSASWGSGSAAGKDDRAPRAGGGQNRLLSAALQNTRDARGSGKRSSGGGRGGKGASSDQ